MGEPSLFMFFSRKGKGLLFPTLLASILHSSSFVLVRSPFQSSSPIWANPRKEAFGGGGAKESLPLWGGAKKGKGEEGLLGTTGRSVGLAGQEEEEERRDPNVQDGPKDGGGGGRRKYHSLPWSFGVGGLSLQPHSERSLFGGPKQEGKLALLT